MIYPIDSDDLWQPKKPISKDDAVVPSEELRNICENSDLTEEELQFLERIASGGLLVRDSSSKTLVPKEQKAREYYAEIIRKLIESDERKMSRLELFEQYYQSKKNPKRS